MRVIPVRAVITRAVSSGGSVSRAAVYKALIEKRLTSADLYGVQGVRDDAKLKRFLKDAKVRNGKPAKKKRSK